MDFQIKNFAKRVYKNAMEEDVLSHAAEVAFYFIFALFPFLLFVTSLFGLVLKTGNDLQQKMFSYLQRVMPPSAYEVVADTLSEVVNNSSGGTLTLGFLIALWSASAGMDAIITTLNDVYDFEETRPYWKRKIISIFLVLCVSLLLFFVLAVVVYGSGLISLILTTIGLPLLPNVVTGFISLILVLAALLFILTLIYTFGPAHPEFEWHWFNAGSVAAIILWILFSIGFRIYLNYFGSYTKTYGSLGAIIILLLWLYITALVILIGGIINAIIDNSDDEEIHSSEEIVAEDTDSQEQEIELIELKDDTENKQA